MGSVLLAVAVPVLVLLFALGMEQLETSLLPPRGPGPMDQGPTGQGGAGTDAAPVGGRLRARRRPLDAAPRGLEQRIHHGPDADLPRDAATRSNRRGDARAVRHRLRVAERAGRAEHLGEVRRVVLGYEPVDRGPQQDPDEPGTPPHR